MANQSCQTVKKKLAKFFRKETFNVNKKNPIKD